MHKFIIIERGKKKKTCNLTFLERATVGIPTTNLPDFKMCKKK